MGIVLITNQTTPATPAAGKIALFGDSVDGNLGFVNSAGTVVKVAPIASPTFTGTPTVPTAAAGTNNTQVASAAFATTMSAAARYYTILQAEGSHIAAQAAGTYMVPNGNPLAISGTGILFSLATINIVAADWPTVNGITTKLRVRQTVHVNGTAPTGNFTMGLYPLTTGAGVAGLKIFTVGTLVTGSGSGTVTAPAASTSTVATGADFALPADGLYCLAVVTTATVATASLVQINGILQMRNT